MRFRSASRGGRVGCAALSPHPPGAHAGPSAPAGPATRPTEPWVARRVPPRGDGAARCGDLPGPGRAHAPAPPPTGRFGLSLNRCFGVAMRGRWIVDAIHMAGSGAEWPDRVGPWPKSAVWVAHAFWLRAAWSCCAMGQMSLRDGARAARWVRRDRAVRLLFTPMAQVNSGSRHGECRESVDLWRVFTHALRRFSACHGSKTDGS